MKPTHLELVILPSVAGRFPGWPARITSAVSGVSVSACTSREVAVHVLAGGAEAGVGTLDPGLLAAASALRWLAYPGVSHSPRYYFPELVSSPVVVTNMRGIYDDHASTHVMACLLAFSRGFHRFLPEHIRGRWGRAPELGELSHLPATTALIVGTGCIGGATAVHCKHFGMHVIGIDPRVENPPPGIDELFRPESLDQQLGRADFVIMTAPHTPHTQGMIDRNRLARMKDTAFLINVGSGTALKLDDLDTALRKGVIGGAALDVFEQEPLPRHHPLWTAPNILITPHFAGIGPHLDERRLQILIENCRRFIRGESLLNVVDKEQWF